MEEFLEQLLEHNEGRPLLALLAILLILAGIFTAAYLTFFGLFVFIVGAALIWWIILNVGEGSLSGVFIAGSLVYYVIGIIVGTLVFNFHLMFK